MKKKLALALAAIMAVCALSGCTNYQGVLNNTENTENGNDIVDSFISIFGQSEQDNSNTGNSKAEQPEYYFGISMDDIPESPSSDFKYEKINGNVKITKYIGNSTIIKIPSSIDGGNVISIGKKAFYNCRQIWNISIPESVTEIGDAAFEWCTGLTNITIPDSVTDMGEQTFTWCNGLKSVTLSNNLTKIGDKAIWGCNGLTSITIPYGVTEIGEWAFYECTGLTDITIPNSVTEIGDYAFNGCTGLTDITIPDSVTEIGRSAFYGCTNIIATYKGKTYTADQRDDLYKAING